MIERDRDNISDVNHELDVINEKISHIQEITSTIENLAASGLEAFNQHLTSQDQNKRLEIEFRDKKNKRALILLGVIVSAVLVLVLTAMLHEQFQLVSTILNSSLALGAGAGLAKFISSGHD